PNLSSIGIMLPYAPLFEIVLNDFGKPIVATSANISNAPIIYKDDEALENLFSIADVVITHNREIVTPQDDSVIRFSQRHQQQIIIR
ncbi:Sua5/YciO/YrdC/YwlC family protein, partial [Klebsiella pneumoniae]|uniref:Sua5/YciO/YrdC/YwlC family protein n=1 Tax=Klebsiella pneumoniae TaxID=573 RepID=UPI00385353FE